MKRKLICMALALTMGLSMATPTFAGIGTGDVNSDGKLTADDAAQTLQYVLDYTYNGNPSAGVTFDVSQANYNGDYRKDENGAPTDQDLISAADCERILSDVLYGFSDVIVRVQASSGMGFTMAATDSTSSDSSGVLIKVNKVLDEADKLAADDTFLNDNVGRLNNFLDKLSFNKANIREETGWAKFAGAVGGLVKDDAEFGRIKQAVTGDELRDAASVRSAYESAKKAFPAGQGTDAVSTAGQKFIDITGENFIKLERLDPETGAVVTTMYTRDIIDAAVANNLQDYDQVTLMQLLDIFGTNVRVTVENPSTGYTNVVNITAERI